MPASACCSTETLSCTLPTMPALPSWPTRPSDWLLYYPSLRRLHEADQHLHILAAVGLGLQLGERLRGVELGGEQNLISVMDPADALAAEAAAFEADFVQPEGVGVAFGRGEREGQNILRNGSAAPDVGMRADAHELVDRAERSDHGPVFHGYVAAQGRSVREDGVVADHAVVRDVGVGHDQRVASDAGEATAARRPTADGDVLADHVVVTDLEPRRLALVFQVLRLDPDRSKGEDAIVVANARWPT